MLFFHSLILQGLSGLCSDQASCVSPGGLQPEGSQSKTQGLHLPHPTPQQHSGKGGIGGGRASKLKAKQEENSLCKGSCLLIISAEVKARSTRKISGAKGDIK